MFLLKILTTSMIGAGMIVLLLIMPKFRGQKQTYYICAYAIVTYILSILSIWWT